MSITYNFGILFTFEDLQYKRGERMHVECRPTTFERDLGQLSLKSDQYVKVLLIEDVDERR
jgi:hypothetical protein